MSQLFSVNVWLKKLKDWNLLLQNLFMMEKLMLVKTDCSHFSGNYLLIEGKQINLILVPSELPSFCRSPVWSKKMAAQGTTFNVWLFSMLRIQRGAASERKDLQWKAKAGLRGSQWQETGNSSKNLLLSKIFKCTTEGEERGDGG